MRRQTQWTSLAPGVLWPLHCPHGGLGSSSLSGCRACLIRGTAGADSFHPQAKHLGIPPPAPPGISHFPWERAWGSPHQIQGPDISFFPTWCPHRPLASPRGTICLSCHCLVLHAPPLMESSMGPSVCRPAHLPDPTGIRTQSLGQQRSLAEFPHVLLRVTPDISGSPLGLS